MYGFTQECYGLKQQALALADIVDATRLAHLELIFFLIFPSDTSPPRLFRILCCIIKHNTPHTFAASSSFLCFHFDQRAVCCHSRIC